MKHSVKISEKAYNKLEDLKYESRRLSKKKVFSQDIIDFALAQIKECAVCVKKFNEWVSKGQ